MSAGGGAYGRQPQSFHPPVRDAASIKYVLYGPGHEKFPSWPMTADADVPLAVRSPPTGGSQRSKSWTDHTDYPKQQPPPYTRPYMKRSEQQQLKTLVERYEKVSVIDSNFYINGGMEHRSKPIIKDMALTPERDRQKDLKLMPKGFGKDTIMSLTQADLEEYNKNLDETTLVQHQKQSSYAQSEGYYSYVSSSDSSSTPFIDSLKRDIDASISRVSSWDGESIATTRSGSVSSSETLKRRGSISDMSDVCNSSGVSPRQLIVHSARVQTPQKQSTESVLMAPRSFCDTQHRRPSIETPTPPPPPPHRFEHHASSPKAYPVPVTPRKTVAECINLYEKKNIKVIQKKALLSYFERHQEKIKKDVNTNDTIVKHHMTSSQQIVSELTMPNMKIQDMKSPVVTTDMPNSIFQGPIIMGPSISLDDWVPERPPKNKKLLDSILSENVKSRKNPSHESMLSCSFSRPNNIAYKHDISYQGPIEKMNDCNAGMFLKPEMSLTEAQISLSNTSNFMHISAQKGREYPINKQQLRSGMGSFNTHHHSHMNTADRKSDVQILDKVPLKLGSNNMFKGNENEISKLAPYRQGSFKYKPLVDTHGLFMNESLNKLNNTNKYLESSITLQKKNEQLLKNIDNLDHSVEISGRYRAEPLIIQSETANCQYNPLITTSSNESKPCNSVHNINFPNYPKMHRSNSELNHGHFVQELSPYSSTLSMNCKTIFQNSNPRKLSYSESMNKNIVNTQFCRQNISVTDDAVINHRLYDTDLNGYQQTNLDSVYKKEKAEAQNENNKEKPPILKKKPNVKSPPENNTHEELQMEPEKLSVESPKQNYDMPVKSMSAVKDDDIGDVSEEKELVIPKSTSSVLISDSTKSKHLYLRKQLPEEIEWGCMKQIILHKFSENVEIVSLLSEFDECKKTMKLILDTFEVDDNDFDFVETLSNTEATDVRTAKSEENDNSNEQIECPEKTIESNSKNNKEKVEEYLTNLLRALENHAAELESKMKANDELGLSIVNVLTKPYSARAGRLIKDVELITSLTSSLLSRYNRIQKSLQETSIDHHTIDKLELERGRLSEKLDDAKTLKKDIENNRTKVFSALEKELEGHLTDNYKFCINTKIRLVIYIKDAKDRIDIVKRLYKELNQDNLNMFLSNY